LDDEPWRPVVADVLALQDATILALGQEPAPLMAGGRAKLESAVARPRMAAHYAEADLCEQAALLAIGIAQAHTFVDNNKRVGYIVGVTFLRLNRRPLPGDQTLAFAKHIEAAVERAETTSDVGNWLREVTAALS